MTTESQVPESLRPYKTLGLIYTIKGKEAIADCPFCGREGKLSISIEKGLCRCFSCEIGSGKGGLNPLSFVREFHKVSYETTTDYSELVSMKGYLEAETLAYWEISRNLVNGRWQVPAWDVDGKLAQLYQYVETDKGMTLIPIPGLRHQMFRLTQEEEKPIVYLFEGPWDAIAFWEVANRTKLTDGEYKSTGNPTSSILSDANVVAMPGVGSIGEPFEKFLPYFSDKIVCLMFDSDWPRKNVKTGKETPPAGFRATKKAVEMLSGSDSPCSEIEYLYWGEEGYDPDRPSGFDVRDFLRSGGNTLSERIGALGDILGSLDTVPDEWKKEPGTLDANSSLSPLECYSYQELVDCWREALMWTEGLDYALSTMIASIISTTSAGDQLWVKIIGPASCGKTTLCEAVSVARKYVLARSTIRGFFSGYKTDKNGEEDHSLAVLARNKTLVTKDGDTLLQSPNLSQILSEARDLYDRTSRTNYRTGVNREYKNLNMTWILCGTSSLKSIDSSELGERFLDCVIMEQIDEDLEDTIGWSKANRAIREIMIEADGDRADGQDPNLIEAMRKTGGYVEHLCETFRDKVVKVGKNFPEEYLRKCTRLGKLVSCLRARPSIRQAESVERELSARLVSQITRLAICTAVATGKDGVDAETMNRTIKVAFDTSRGPTLDIVDYLHSVGREGSSVKAIQNFTSQTDSELKNYLRFLRKLRVVETFIKKGKNIRTTPMWRLTGTFSHLYETVGYEDEQT